MAISYSDTVSEGGFGAGEPLRGRVGFARPKFLDGLVFGFVFRFIVGVFAVLTPVALLFFMRLVFGDALQLTGFVFAFLTVFIVITVFLGEHLRSRVYERATAGVRPGREERQVVADLAHSILEGDIQGDWKTPPGPLSVTELINKRVFDIVFACLLIIALSPLFLVIGLAIKLDSRGPIIVRQFRLDFQGRQFLIFKFRTMLVEVSHVTKLGRFLRLTSMDELPQLFNVLRGELSMVGPRAHFVGEGLNSVTDSLASRYRFRPGLTGLSQLMYFDRDYVWWDKMKEKEFLVESELQYMRRWSVWLDIRILARTLVSVVLRGS